MSGSVIWITGLSGSGKTTLSKILVNKLHDRGIKPILLDGDDLRYLYGSGVFSRRARLDLAIKYSHLCHLLSIQGFVVVIATISLFKEVHAINHSLLPGYVEVYLKVPLEELKKRDTKGVYQQTNVVGLDIPFDEPEDADFIFEYPIDFEFASDDIILGLQLRHII